MTYSIDQVLAGLTSGSSFRELAMAPRAQIITRLTQEEIAYDDDLLEYIEMAACDLAAEQEGD